MSVKVGHPCLRL